MCCRRNCALVFFFGGLALGLGRGLAVRPFLGPDPGLVLDLLAPAPRGFGLGFGGLLRAVIQRREHRQRPGPGGERERDQDGQDDPFVPPAEGGVGMGRAHRVAMTALAIDFGAAALVDGIVASQIDRPVGDPMIEDESGQEAGQDESGPASFGEDAVKTGGVAFGQAGGGPEQVGDGAAAGGEDGGQEQDEKALVGGMVEGRGEPAEDGLGELGYSQHEDHLVEEPWGVRLPMFLTRWSAFANCAAPLLIS